MDFFLNWGFSKDISSIKETVPDHSSRNNEPSGDIFLVLELSLLKAQFSVLYPE